MAFTVQIQGLDKLLTKVKTLPKEIQVEISSELELSAQNIVEKAKLRVPKDFGGGGGLVSKIGSNKTGKPMTYEIFADQSYAPYVEFGTGRFVFQNQPWVDAELMAYARTFYVNGKGKLPPQPYFFNSFFEEKPVLIKNLKKVLELKK